VMSEKTWEKLSSEQQKVIADALAAAAKEAVDRSESEDNEYLAKLKEKGIKVHDFSGEVAEKFVAEVRASAWPSLEERFGSDLVNCLKSDVD